MACVFLFGRCFERRFNLQALCLSTVWYRILYIVSRSPQTIDAILAFLVLFCLIWLDLAVRSIPFQLFFLCVCVCVLYVGFVVAFCVVFS